MIYSLPVSQLEFWMFNKFGIEMVQLQMRTTVQKIQAPNNICLCAGNVEITQ